MFTSYYSDALHGGVATTLPRADGDRRAEEVRGLVRALVRRHVLVRLGQREPDRLLGIRAFDVVAWFVAARGPRGGVHVEMEIRVPTALHEKMKRAGYPGS